MQFCQTSELNNITGIHDFYRKNTEMKMQKDYMNQSVTVVLVVT